jgi:hypothetical protein
MTVPNFANDPFYSRYCPQLDAEGCRTSPQCVYLDIGACYTSPSFANDPFYSRYCPQLDEAGCRTSAPQCYYM